MRFCLSRDPVCVWAGAGNGWYKLAEVNGLTGDETLAEGTPLTIPAGVMRNTNNAQTFNVFCGLNPTEVFGGKRVVGAERFELSTPSPPDWCANQAAPRSANRRPKGGRVL